MGLRIGIWRHKSETEKGAGVTGVGAAVRVDKESHRMNYRDTRESTPPQAAPLPSARESDLVPTACHHPCTCSRVTRGARGARLGGHKDL